MRAILYPAFAVIAGSLAPGAFALNSMIPHVWLEDVHGQKGRWPWVAENKNVRSLGPLKADSAATRKKLRFRIAGAWTPPTRIPSGRSSAMALSYNFWQDAANPKGVWRRHIDRRLSGHQTPTWEVAAGRGCAGQGGKRTTGCSRAAECFPPAEVALP